MVGWAFEGLGLYVRVGRVGLGGARVAKAFFFWGRGRCQHCDRTAAVAVLRAAASSV